MAGTVRGSRRGPFVVRDRRTDAIAVKYDIVYTMLQDDEDVEYLATLQREWQTLITFDGTGIPVRSMEQHTPHAGCFTSWATDPQDRAVQTRHEVRRRGEEVRSCVSEPTQRKAWKLAGSWSLPWID